MSCTIPSVSMAVLRSRVGTRAFAERIPLWAYVEIIATCNFSCKHCYIAPCAERGDLMTLEQAEVLFDKLVDAGTLSLLLTGGEVFTHRQFKEIYLAAKRRGQKSVLRRRHRPRNQQAKVDEVTTVQRNLLARALVDQGADRNGRRVDDRRFRRHAHLLGDGGDTQLNLELAV